MGRVVALGGAELFRHAREELHSSMLVLLVEGCSNGKLACVDEEMEIVLGLGKTHGYGSSHGSFECGDGLELGFADVELVVRFQEFGEWGCFARVVFDEPLVEVAEA